MDAGWRSPARGTSRTTSSCGCGICGRRTSSTSSIDLPTYQGQLCSLAVSRERRLDRHRQRRRGGAAVADQQSDAGRDRDRPADAQRSGAGDSLRAGRQVADHRRRAAAAAKAPCGPGASTAATLRPTWCWPTTRRGVELFAITSDGRWLFTANEEPSLRVRDLDGARRRRNPARCSKAKRAPCRRWR